MKHIYKVMILATCFSSKLMADSQTDKIIAVQQSQIQAQQAALLRLTAELNVLKAEVGAQKTAITNLGTTVAGKILYADPAIGGWYDSFNLDRSADQWCKSQGYLGGVANHQAMGENRGLFCFK